MEKFAGKDCNILFDDADFNDNAIQYRFRSIAACLDHPGVLRCASALGRILGILEAILPNETGQNRVALINKKGLCIIKQKNITKTIKCGYFIDHIMESANVDENVGKKIWEAFVKVILEQKIPLPHNNLKIKITTAVITLK